MSIQATATVIALEVSLQRVHSDILFPLQRGQMNSSKVATKDPRLRSGDQALVSRSQTSMQALGRMVVKESIVGK